MTPQPARRWTWKGLAAVAGSVATAAAVLFGAVWAGATATADRTGQLREHGRQLDDHEGRLRAVERDVNQIAADVRWIRQRMEKQP